MSRTKESRQARCTSVDGPARMRRSTLPHNASSMMRFRAMAAGPRTHGVPRTPARDLSPSRQLAACSGTATMLPTAGPWEHRGCVLFWWAILGLNQ